MFLPKSSTQVAEEHAATAQMKQGIERVEQWTMYSIPERLRNGVQVNVSEVQCGDPNCSPIDTAILMQFPSGGRGMLGIPLEARDVKTKDLEDVFPPEYVLEKWYKGEEAEWPPFDDDLLDPEPDPVDDILSSLPALRFTVGQKVQCRIGPDPVLGWADGMIMQLWYKEQGWPENSWAPYKVELDDGRKIFAPGDIDQIIRARY